MEKLKAAGVNTVESLADMTPEQLEAIEGIGPKTVEKISIAVNNYFATLDGGEAAAAVEAESAGEAATEAASSEELPAEGGLEAGPLSVDAEAAETAPADESAGLSMEEAPAEEAATEAAATEEAPEDKQI